MAAKEKHMYIAACMKISRTWLRLKSFGSLQIENHPWHLCTPCSSVDHWFSSITDSLQWAPPLHLHLPLHLPEAMGQGEGLLLGFWASQWHWVCSLAPWKMTAECHRQSPAALQVKSKFQLCLLKASLKGSANPSMEGNSIQGLEEKGPKYSGAQLGTQCSWW